MFEGRKKKGLLHIALVALGDPVAWRSGGFIGWPHRFSWHPFFFFFSFHDPKKAAGRPTLANLRGRFSGEENARVMRDV